MSISGALANALSGLGATTRGAEVISSNVANALTDGYGRRSLDLASYGLGGGVRVVSLQRHVSQAVVEDRRAALSGQGAAETRTAFLQALNDAYGVPGSDLSLADRLAGVSAALAGAAARPESASLLEAAVAELDGLVSHVNRTSQVIQTARGEADAAIGHEIDLLNGALRRIEAINKDIQRHGAGDATAAALLDERQALVDQVASIVPVREIDRGNGRIALMTPGGEMLVDDKAAVLGFTPTRTLTPYMSHAAGDLSGITVNGREIDITRAGHALSGGTLGAHVEVRDRLAPAAQTELDAVARDLVERFADPAVDPTLGPGDPGLLTDAGGAFVPGDDLGLATWLRLNAAVDVEAGGAVWRLRDGLGAAGPGDVGQGAGLLRLAAALDGTRTIATGAQAGLDRDAAGLLSDVTSAAGSALVLGEAEAARSGARADILTGKLLSEGVDTDEEMQKLLQIEQAYAANARVIETVESMLDALMRI